MPDRNSPGEGQGLTRGCRVGPYNILSWDLTVTHIILRILSFFQTS